MAASQEHHLAPPGAGLPTLELLTARTLFALRRWGGSRRSFDARFAGERERIRSHLRIARAEEGSRRVLIQRMPAGGIERAEPRMRVACPRVEGARSGEG